MKSWDLRTEREGARYFENQNNVPFGTPHVRVVPWPLDAPPPSTVPQAGDEVVVKALDSSSHGGSGRRFKTEVYATKYEVTNGIPYQRQDGKWRLRVHGASGETLYPVLDAIVPFVEPAVTYTPREVTRAIKLAKDGYLSHTIMAIIVGERS